MKVESRRRMGLESQNDLGYITGRHDDAERARQVATPQPRRAEPSPGKGEEQRGALQAPSR